MNTKLAVFLLSTFCFQLTVLAQGSLTPPGAPAPTMKSLDQVEARTAITNAGAVTLSQPGSYYLTRNITVSSGNAITIATHGVTLDLNGFTVASTAASATGRGILINGGLRNLTIANGFIQGGVTNNGSGVYSGSGFAYGIYYSGGAPVNVLVSRVLVSGCLYSGIYLGDGDSTVVESCTARTVGSSGIVASTVKQSSAIDCGSYAIFGNQVSDCRGEASGSAPGVNANTALNCYGYSSTGAGVAATAAQNCYGWSGGNGAGVSANTALNCYGRNNGDGDGVSANSAQNCYGSSGGNGSGVRADTAQNCYGSSNSSFGVAAETALNCRGYSTSGDGVIAFSVASGCSGYSSSGKGVSAYIAHVCHGSTSTGLAIFTAHNVNSY